MNTGTRYRYLNDLDPTISFYWKYKKDKVPNKPLCIMAYFGSDIFLLLV